MKGRIATGDRTILQDDMQERLGRVHERYQALVAAILNKADRSSKHRIANAVALFESNPQAKPYFHNVWIEVRTGHNRAERKEEKVLFFGLPDEDLSAVKSPDRRFFLLRQEEIDQHAHITDLNWMGFIDKGHIRQEDPYLAINHWAANRLMTSNIDKDRAGRIRKWGTRLQLLERWPELDALTPAEREVVHTRVRAIMPTTPTTPVIQWMKSHDARSGSMFRRKKEDRREKARMQYEEKRERGMLSNEEMKVLKANDLLSEHRRPPGTRRAQGPITALYEKDWEAERYSQNHNQVKQTVKKSRWFW